MLRAILNKSWKQYPTKQQLNGQLPPITKTIKVRRTRLARICRIREDKLISDVLLWTPSHGRAKARRPARTDIQHLFEDTGCSPEDLSEAMKKREEWRERVRDIRAGGMTRWWWFISMYMCVCVCVAQFYSLSKIGWDCKINQLHLLTGLWPSSNTSDCDAPVLELWRMWSSPSLPFLPDPPRPGVVAPGWVLSMRQIELFGI